MFSHIMLGARDLEAMTGFYDAVMAPIGLSRDSDADKDDPAGTAAGRSPQFAIRYSINGRAASWMGS